MLKICRPQLVASGWVVTCNVPLDHVPDCVKYHRDRLEGFVRINKKAIGFCLDSDIDSVHMCTYVLTCARREVLSIVCPEAKCHYYRVVVYEVTNGRYVVLTVNMSGVLVLEPLMVEVDQPDVSQIENIVLNELKKELVGKIYVEDRYWYTGTQLRELVRKLIE